MATIKNIIFDFGNVLLDIDMGRIGQHFQELLGPQSAVLRDKLQREGVFALYETGGLSTEEFVDTLRLAATPVLPREQVEQAWNSIFIGMPAERFDMLLRLRQRYKVFLLSNINDLHERWINAYMQREHGLSDFESRYFDAVYYSHLIRLRKPERDIYEYVLADADILPSETLFIDDLEENIAGAAELGIRGIVKTPDRDIIDILSAF